MFRCGSGISSESLLLVKTEEINNYRKLHFIMVCLELFLTEKYSYSNYLLKSYSSFGHMNNCMELNGFPRNSLYPRTKKMFVVPGSVFALGPSLYRRTYSSRGSDLSFIWCFLVAISKTFLSLLEGNISTSRSLFLTYFASRPQASSLQHLSY